MIKKIDCTQSLGPEQYFESDATVVVPSPLGHYREAVGKQWARFGYRFAIRNAGRPHEVVIRYPDDKARFMGIMDGTSYDLSTGVITGGELPLSNAMQEVRMVFWPRWTDCSIIFMTSSAKEPAAVASIEVRELDALPALATRGRALSRHGRDFGLAFEDPCGMSCSVGAMDRKEWVDHVAAYMRHTGQSLLLYPIAWYHGPQFPSKREPADAFEIVVSHDRRMYGRYTTRPADWVTPLLKRFSREGLRFIAEVRFMRLGSLMQKMNTDLDAIKAGADTINNMLWNDQVQSGTMDWTVVYNARNYPYMLEHGLTIDVPWKSGFPFAYGEKAVGDVGGGYPSTIQPPGAIFNPLHPTVQEAVIGFAREIGLSYGKYPAFGGIATNLWPQNFLWFGSLRRGYDDFTVNLFQQETGIAVPVDRKAPDRFSRRYLFLTANCREEWIAWRCHKIRALLRKVRDALREGRSDLPLMLMPGMGAWAEQAVGRPAPAMMREAGLDLDLLSGEEGIEVVLTLEGGGGSRSAAGDLDGFDPAAWTTLRSMPQSGACIFDSWVESWGKSKMFPCDPGDAQAKELAVIAGKPADIYRFTCEFPPDGFWFEDQWRIATPFAADPYFMAPYAQAVAQSDALFVTRGGLYADTAHPDAQRKFALAYRALPKKKFETVGPVTDPVAVRTLVHGGRRYLYAVNREYYPAHTTIAFSRAPRGLTDLATGARVPATSTLTLNLGPYELRSFSLSKEAVPQSFKAAIPSAIRKDLLKRAGQTLADFMRQRSAGRYLSGMDRLEAGIRSAVSDGRFAWLRHALAAVQKDAALRRFTPFARTVQVSRILPGAGKLETLSFPAERAALGFQTRTFGEDFCDVHTLWESDKEDKIIYFVCRVKCVGKMRLAACLGYDGPVKVWIDGREKFHDPNGTNPAARDAAKIAFTATPGIHEIVVALSSNHGQAWGIYLRCERLDEPGKKAGSDTVDFVE